MAVPATGNLFAEVLQTPAVQSLLQRLEAGGALSCFGVSLAAQPFLAALLSHAFPQRPLVVVTDGLKAQETFQQDIETWLRLTEDSKFKVQGLKFKVADTTHPHNPQSPIHNPQLFYPSWEILPHESKLPHADVISERLETLVALSTQSPIRNCNNERRRPPPTHLHRCDSQSAHPHFESRRPHRASRPHRMA